MNESKVQKGRTRAKGLRSATQTKYIIKSSIGGGLIRETSMPVCNNTRYYSLNDALAQRTTCFFYHQKRHQERLRKWNQESDDQDQISWIAPGSHAHKCYYEAPMELCFVGALSGRMSLVSSHVLLCTLLVQTEKSWLFNEEASSIATLSFTRLFQT